jgi:hypothetical protein
MKGVKNLHFLDIKTITELLEFHYDDLDFELGPAPYYYLKLIILCIVFTPLSADQ